MNRIYGSTKISFLSESIVRFEQVSEGSFSNLPTLFVPEKHFENSEYVFHENGNDVILSYGDLEFRFGKDRPIDSLRVYDSTNNLVYSYKGKANSGELPVPSRTPFVFLLNDSPRILLPEEGYVPGAEFRVEKHNRDVYFLVCRKDYRLLRKQFMSLTGHNEMPTLRAFGLFHSAFRKYTEKDILRLVDAYRKNRIPLDNFIVDTDWRKSEIAPGCGYEVDKSCFPDMRRFIGRMHERNIDVIFNDHPLPVSKKATVFAPEEVEYRYSNIMNLFDNGLDYLWYDRNWSSKLRSPSKRVMSESLGNYVFHDLTRQFYQSLVLDPEVYQRPYVLTNIVDVCQGKYNGMKDSSSHRYAVQWSGDILSDPSSLKQEIANMIRSANSMMGYYSSDIGGHNGNPGKEEYIRWMQYGAFSPVFRPHCVDTALHTREPWKYDKTTLDIARNYIQMRYRLLDVFYTAAYKHFQDGLGIAKPLFLAYPEDRKCMNDRSSYLINDEILVHPLTEDEFRPLTKANYFRKVRVTSFDAEGKKISSANENTIFRPDDGAASYQYDGKVVFKDDVNLEIFSDGETKVFLDGHVILNDRNHHLACYSFLRKLKKNKQYKIRILYTPAAESDWIHPSIGLFCSRSLRNTKLKMYLPEGEWFDVSHSGVYQGRRYVKKKYTLEEMPLFVKAGTLLPLYYADKNIGSMSLRNIVYDFYPSKNSATKDFFYEDDGVTTGYRIGVNRINSYSLSFHPGTRTYSVRFDGCGRTLDDGITARNVLFKMHVPDGEKILSVTVNGESVRFRNHDHSKDAVPFSSTAFARDSKTLSFKFRQELKTDYEILIKIQ